MKLKARTAVYACLTIAVGLLGSGQARAQTTALDRANDGETTPCALSDDQSRWIQTALDGWERVSRDFLHVAPLPLPWIVLFDRSCAWHLAPDEARLPDATPVRPGLTFAGESEMRGSRFTLPP